MAIKNLGKVVPQKGVDYFTEQDIKNLNIPTKTSQLINDSNFANETYVDNAINNIKESGGSSLTTAQINSLNNLFKVCAFVKEDVSEEYNAFLNAFSLGGSGDEEGGEEPDIQEVTLVSISATYTGGEVEAGTNVNSLTGINVKATYSDGSTKNVTDYTMSGTIKEGNNTITISYEGKTTTIIVVGYVDSGEDEGEENTSWTDGEPYTINWTDGYYITSNGSPAPFSGISVSDFMPCDGVSTLECKKTETKNEQYNCFYDANKAKISTFIYIASGSTTNVPVPENATYFRVSVYTDQKESVTFIPRA